MLTNMFLIRLLNSQFRGMVPLSQRIFLISLISLCVIGSLGFVLVILKDCMLLKSFYFMIIARIMLPLHVFMHMRTHVPWYSIFRNIPADIH